MESDECGRKVAANHKKVRTPQSLRKIMQEQKRGNEIAKRDTICRKDRRRSEKKQRERTFTVESVQIPDKNVDAASFIGEFCVVYYLSVEMFFSKKLRQWRCLSRGYKLLCEHARTYRRTEGRTQCCNNNSTSLKKIISESGWLDPFPNCIRRGHFPVYFVFDNTPNCVAPVFPQFKKDTLSFVGEL